MDAKKKKSFGIVIIFLVNIILLTGLVIAFFVYDNGYRGKLYNQNLDEISNINQASANISSTFFTSREESLRDLSMYIEKNELTAEESMDFISGFSADEVKSFELIGSDFCGYLIRKDESGAFIPVDYSSGYGDLCKIFQEHEQETDDSRIHFSAEFTDGYTAMKSFASYCHVYLPDDTGEKTLYTLMVVSKTADFISMININSGYDKLATTIINGSGDYIIGNSEFKSDNFFEFLAVFNDLTLDQKKEIQTGVSSNVKGNLTYENGRGTRCVYVYTPVAEKDWYCVTVVPVDSFQNGETDFSFAGMVAAIMLLIFVTDMLYLTLLNKKLKTSIRNERIASAAKTDFLSRMSHDMRTPMNGILGLAELSEEETDAEVLHNNIYRIRESGDYLLSLINDTLDFQRIESGKLTLEKKVVDIRAVISSITDVVRPAVEKKNIRFEVRYENVEDRGYFLLDPVRFKQIFINLLSNAVKFTPENGNILFSIGCSGRDDRIFHHYLKVSDNGLGMSEDFLKNHIFKAFSQESSEVSAQYAGSGLGLSIVKKLVEMMDGRIEVESELKKGTTFTVFLNLQQVDEKDAGQYRDRQKEELGDAKEQLAGRRILLAEDHPLNAEISRRLLEKAGCTVTWAENGLEAVDTFQSHPAGSFDVILMDIRMPVVDGIEATGMIRSMDRADAASVPIIAMTANAFDEDVKKCIKAGMNAHIAKPIQVDLMYRTIADVLKDAKK